MTRTKFDPAPLQDLICDEICKPFGVVFNGRLPTQRKALVELLSSMRATRYTQETLWRATNGKYDNDAIHVRSYDADKSKPPKQTNYGTMIGHK